MQISSAFSAGMQGLQAAQSGLTQATVDVAQASVQPTSASSAENSSNAVAAVGNRPDTTSALVSAMVSERQGEASVDVLQRASDTLGSIIDIEV